MKALLIIIIALMLLVPLTAEKVVLSNSAKGLNLTCEQNNENRIQLDLRVNAFSKIPVKIESEEFNQIRLQEAVNHAEAGYPDLPVIAKSVIIPPTSSMKVHIIESDYHDYQINVAPSKGSILRTVDPATVPYTFSDLYIKDDFYPQNVCTLSSPYILRDYRALTVNISPFLYNPVKHTLRVYDKLKIELYSDGTDNTNTLVHTPDKYSRDFKAIYANRFINFNPYYVRYNQVSEQGKMLVICPPEFIGEMQPYVDWKKQKGIPTILYDLNMIGTTAEEIKDFIQLQYEQDTELTFVQLVGDAAQLPTYDYLAGGSDPMYSLVSGDDGYPDVFIGRFSAENSEQLATQVQRTLYYEKDLSEGSWLKKGMGIGSEFGPGDDDEYDWEHTDNIRQKLLNYTTHPYTSVDQLNGEAPTAQMVSEALNEGRGIINYCGHGDDTSWITTYFSCSDITFLQNDNKLPFITSVACVNGNFVNGTCFAETWLRSINPATNQPIGAIGAYMSLISQSWDEPMVGQDEIIDLLVSDQLSSFGGLCFNGSCKMIENCGTEGATMFKAWTVFGDASLQIRTDIPQPIVYNTVPVLHTGDSSLSVTTNSPDLAICLADSITHRIIATAITDSLGNATLSFPAFNNPQRLLLTLTGYNKITQVRPMHVLLENSTFITCSEPIFANPPVYNTENLQFGFALQNIGTTPTQNLRISVQSSDSYIHINSGTQTIADLASDGSVTLPGLFSMNISDNVPDQHLAEIVVTITSGGHATVYYYQFLIGAPILSVEFLSVTELNGNGNEILESGEQGRATLLIKNTGHAVSPEINGTLTCGNANIQIPDPVYTLTPLSESAVIQSTVDFQILSGTPAGLFTNLGAFVVGGQYRAIASGLCEINVPSDGFETNDFTRLPWQQSGSVGWQVHAYQPVEGSHSAKSGHTLHSQSSILSVELNIPYNTVLKFYRRTSCEPLNDHLTFTIDNTVYGQWTGETGWAEVQYPVTAGNHVFKWTYSKNASVTGGYDCVWIDKVRFITPAQNWENSAIFTLDQDSLNFGNVAAGQSSTRTIYLANSGLTDLYCLFNIPQWVSLTDESDVPLSASITLSPGTIKPVKVIFSPLQNTPYGALLTFNTNDVLNPVRNTELYANGGTIGTEDPQGIDGITRLNRNYPNPFNPETNISFNLAQTGNVKICIYNIKGQKVRSLLNEYRTTGKHQIRWNGKDDQGTEVGSGIYFIRMEAGDYASVHKAMLLK